MRTKHLVISIQILQNGSPIISYQQSLDKKKDLFLTTKLHCPLSIPYYPLPEQILLFSVTKNIVYFYPNNRCEGFVKHENKIINFCSYEENKKKPIPLKNNDFGSLLLYGLKINFKIFEKIIVKNKNNYFQKTPAPFFFFPITLSSEKNFFVLSVLFSFFLSVLGYYSVTKIKHQRPRSMVELQEHYILPFIAPEHFSTAPEALQSNFHSKQLVSRVIDYYQEVTDLMTGWQTDDFKYLFKNTYNKFKNQHKLYKNLEKNKKHQKIDQNKKNTYIQLSAIVGIPIEQELENILKAIDHLHLGFHKSLQARRLFTRNFLSQNTYDFKTYDPRKIEQINKENSVKKTNLWQETKQEKQIYLDAENLAKKAKRFQSMIFGQPKALPPTITPVVVPKDMKGIFIRSDVVFEYNDSLEQKEIPSVSFYYRNKQLQPKLKGNIRTDKVFLVLNKNRKTFRSCYEQLLRYNKNWRGNLTWRWIITQKGRAKNIRLIKGFSRDIVSFKHCLKRGLKSIQFPKARHTQVVIEHVLQFVPQKYL